MNQTFPSRAPLDAPEPFYGRTLVLNELAAFLRGNQSVSLVGPYGIGKTALLSHLMRAEGGDAAVYAYLNAETLKACAQKEILWAFCAGILKALREGNLEPEPALEAALASPTRVSFEGAVRRLNQRGLSVVLILDDFENLSANPHLDMSFLHALRSAAGRYQLVFLTASTRPLIDLTYSNRAEEILSSPFFNIFAPLFLGLLAKEEAHSVIRYSMQAAGHPASPPLVEFLYELVGGSPHALRVGCAEAACTPGDWATIEQRTRQALHPYFETEWERLEPIEQYALAHPDQAAEREPCETVLRVALRSLVQKCLLVRGHDGYRYPSRAWAAFVRGRL